MVSGPHLFKGGVAFLLSKIHQLHRTPHPTPPNSEITLMAKTIRIKRECDLHPTFTVHIYPNDTEQYTAPYERALAFIKAPVQNDSSIKITRAVFGQVFRNCTANNQFFFLRAHKYNVVGEVFMLQSYSYVSRSEEREGEIEAKPDCHDDINDWPRYMANRSHSGKVIATKMQDGTGTLIRAVSPSLWAVAAKRGLSIFVDGVK